MPKNKMSRRNFLKAAGITMAAATVTCSGLGYAATRSPEIETTKSTFGKENTMNERILVTYATRAGSTAEVAAAIGESLSQRGFAVDVISVKDNPQLNDYHSVVMGSAIRMGNWLPEMVDYIKANQSALKGIPVALFTVYMQNTGEDETSRSARQGYLAAIHPLLNQFEEAFFIGKMDLSRLSFLDRMIAKMVKAKDEDLRDWDKIRDWASTVFASELS